MAIDPVTLATLASMAMQATQGSGSTGGTTKQPSKVGVIAKTGLLGLAPFALSKLGFFDKGEDESLVDPRFQAAQQGLLDFDPTFTGQFISDQTTGVEDVALQRLMAQLTGEQPGAIGTAENFLTNFLQEDFDPTGELVGGVRQDIARATQDVGQGLEREAAITGSRFGTQIAKEKGLLGERLGIAGGQTIANLINQLKGRQLGAAGQLSGIGGLQEQIEQSRLEQGFGFGGLQRVLENARKQQQLQQFNVEKGRELAALSAVVGVGQQPEINVPGSASPFSELLNAALGQAGKQAGSRFGDFISDKLKFPQSTTTTV